MKLLFRNYIKSYVDSAIEDIKNSHIISEMINKSFLSEKWHEDIAKSLHHNLEEIVLMSLLDYFKVDINDDEALESCNEQLTEKEILQDFNIKYPVINELINVRIKVETENIILMLERVSENWDDICDKFQLGQANRIDKIQLSLGDYHGSRTVVRIHMKNKQIIMYKTRSGFGEKILNLMIKETGISEVAACIPFTQEYRDFVIQKFVDYNVLLDEDELKCFYWKFGVMAAFFTFLGTYDLHAENIIATKKGPVFIDLETVVTPHMNEFLFNNSALINTYLFMGKKPNKVYEDIDISGFSGIINSQSKRLYNIPGCTKNIKVNPYDYKEYVLDGFDFASSLLLKKKDALEKKISDLEFGLHRKIIRNTGFYGQFILTSLMPKYTKSFIDREKLFDLLSVHSNYSENIVKLEKEALKKLEIPFFEIDEELNSDLGQYDLGYNIKSGFLNRIKNIDDLFFQYEKNILRQLLNIKQSPKHLTDIKSLNISCNRIEYECTKFLNYSLRNGRLSYITLDSSLSEYVIEYSNDLYVFGGALYVLILCSEKYIKDIVNNKIILNTLQNGVNLVKNISAYTGIYATLLLFKIVQRKCGLNELEEKFVNMLEMPILDSIENYDFSGIGSSIIACIILLKFDYYEKLCNQLEELKEKFLENISLNDKNSGLFHGYSGDMITCLFLAESQKEDGEKYLHLIEKLLNLEDELFSSKIKNWRDIRNKENPEHDMVALSYGAPGILITRLILKKYFEKYYCNISQRILPVLEKDIFLAIDKILSTKREAYYDDTLINGYAGGVLAILIAYSSKSDGFSREMKKRMKSYINKAQNELFITEWRVQGKEGVYFPNFMNGNMGIVFLLMLMDDTSLIKEIGLWQK